MIYLVGGAPRTGKTILGERISARLSIGWISTDLLMAVLRAKHVEGTKVEWNAAPEAIAAAAEWFSRAWSVLCGASAQRPRAM